jgi:hypothetical protein
VRRRHWLIVVAGFTRASALCWPRITRLAFVLITNFFMAVMPVAPQHLRE